MDHRRYTKLSWGTLLAVILITFTGFNTASAGEIAIPDKPNSRVLDLTGVLTPLQREALNEQSVAVEKAKSVTLLAVIIPSLEGMPIEEFANGVVSKWRPGINGNAALLVVSKYDKRLRLEVGAGLEGTITDSLSRRILENSSLYFSNGNTAKGVENVFRSINQALPVNYLEIAEASAVPVTPANSNLVKATLFGVVATLLLGLGLLLFGLSGKSSKKNTPPTPVRDGMFPHLDDLIRSSGTSDSFRDRPTVPMKKAPPKPTRIEDVPVKVKKRPYNKQESEADAATLIGLAMSNVISSDARPSPSHSDFGFSSRSSASDFHGGGSNSSWDYGSSSSSSSSYSSSSSSSSSSSDSGGGGGGD